MSQSKLWTKDFIIISCTNFFTHIVFYTLMTTMALYVTKEFQTNQSIAGLVVGIFVLASVVARSVIGKYLDTINRKRAFIWSLILGVIAMGLHLVAASLALLMVIRFIHGLSHGLITTTAGAIVADLIPDERRGEGTGYYSTAMNIAMAVGPFLGILISQHAGFQTIVLAGTITAVVNIIFALFLKVPKFTQVNNKEKAVVQDAVGGWFKLGGFMEPKALPISAIMFALAFTYASLLSFVSIYAAEIDLVQVSSFFFLVYAAALIVTRPFTGKWFDLYGANKMNYPLLAVLSLGYLLLSLANNGFFFLLSAALIGVGYGTLQSNFQAIAIQESPGNRKALATSTFYILIDSSLGVGPYILGFAAQWISFRQLYIAMAVWILVSMGLYYIAHGRKAAGVRDSWHGRVRQRV
ncbi:MFS transporter [Bacillus benzoevorans]|uniref:MFS family permease n=1 Tax=Bacillus benzoevorans TaxID=1456 RepID=A0A7X0HQR5_9BACI|nr:MFS transporter [Bacillus benzoevorans]MBB6445143.1 MFS family permease [Bacillus benzoevorans]